MLPQSTRANYHPQPSHAYFHHHQSQKQMTDSKFREPSYSPRNHLNVRMQPTQAHNKTSPQMHIPTTPQLQMPTTTPSLQLPITPQVPFHRLQSQTPLFETSFQPELFRASQSSWLAPDHQDCSASLSLSIAPKVRDDAKTKGLTEQEKQRMIAEIDQFLQPKAAPMSVDKDIATTTTTTATQNLTELKASVNRLPSSYDDFINPQVRDIIQSLKKKQQLTTPTMGEVEITPFQDEKQKKQEEKEVRCDAPELVAVIQQPSPAKEKLEEAQVTSFLDLSLSKTQIQQETKQEEHLQTPEPVEPVLINIDEEIRLIQQKNLEQFSRSNTLPHADAAPPTRAATVQAKQDFPHSKPPLVASHKKIQILQQESSPQQDHQEHHSPFNRIQELAQNEIHIDSETPYEKFANMQTLQVADDQENQIWVVQNTPSPVKNRCNDEIVNQISSLHQQIPQAQLQDMVMSLVQKVLKEGGFVQRKAMKDASTQYENQEAIHYSDKFQLQRDKYKQQKRESNQKQVTAETPQTLQNDVLDYSEDSFLQAINVLKYTIKQFKEKLTQRKSEFRVHEFQDESLDESKTDLKPPTVQKKQETSRKAVRRSIPKATRNATQQMKPLLWEKENLESEDSECFRSSQS